MDNWTPARFAVFQHRNGKATRVGGFETRERAQKAIDLREEVRGDTLGGLLAPDTDKVTYSIWVADWTPVK